jgi:hypothetical protein
MGTHSGQLAAPIMYKYTHTHTRISCLGMDRGRQGAPQLTADEEEDACVSCEEEDACVSSEEGHTHIHI